jgi:outer membrane protein, multidrug efflux system
MFKQLKNKKYFKFLLWAKAVKYIVLLLLFLFNESCKSYKTNLSIPTQPIPSAFVNDKDSVSSANINWKQYFNDTLLTKLIDTALAGNIDLQMALQRVEVARATSKQARAALFPQINASPMGGLRRYGLYTMDGAGNISTFITPGQIVPVDLPDYYLGLQSSWEVDVWGKLRNQKRAALANYLASTEGLNFVVSNVVSDLAIAYYELIALDNQEAVILKTISKQQEALEVIQLQKEVGRANELAVQQFSAQLLNTQALEKEIQQQIVKVENKINFLIGRFPQKIERKKEAFFNETSTQVKAGIPSMLLANRPDVRQAEQQLKASRFDLKSAKAAFFPSFTITSGLGFQAFNLDYLFLTPTSIAYTAVGSLVTPLINRSAIKANFKRAKANQLELMYNYQKTILNGYVEVSNELAAVENLKQINKFKKEQNEVLKQSVETSRELYKSAKAGYLEVLFAQQNSLQVQLEVIETIKRQHIAYINIYKALGGGWR